MLDKLFFGKDVFSVGPEIVRIAFRFIEGIDGQRAVDFNGFRFIAFIKYQPAAESPHGNLVGLI
jgi:hypothetical protein